MLCVADRAKLEKTPRYLISHYGEHHILSSSKEVTTGGLFEFSEIMVAGEEGDTKRASRHSAGVYSTSGSASTTYLILSQVASIPRG